MKWPVELDWIRHGESAYNVLRDKKNKDPLYAEFLTAFENDWRSERTRSLAYLVWEKYQLGVGDYNTPLTPQGWEQARWVGREMRSKVQIPDVILLSPHIRARQTLEGLCEGHWDLDGVKVVVEPRLREQEHGLALVYNDWRIFHAIHPEQKLLYDLEGSYWYRYPQGESVPDVIERVRSFIGTLVRDYSGEKVWVVSHHLTILSFLAAIFRWDCDEFIRWDKEKKPVNCGLTIFRGNPNVGKDGKLELAEYNLKLY